MKKKPFQKMACVALTGITLISSVNMDKISYADEIDNSIASISTESEKNSDLKKIDLVESVGTKEIPENNAKDNKKNNSETKENDNIKSKDSVTTSDGTVDTKENLKNSVDSSQETSENAKSAQTIENVANNDLQDTQNEKNISDADKDTEENNENAIKEQINKIENEKSKENAFDVAESIKTEKNQNAEPQKKKQGYCLLKYVYEDSEGKKHEIASEFRSEDGARYPSELMGDMGTNAFDSLSKIFNVKSGTYDITNPPKFIGFEYKKPGADGWNTKFDREKDSNSGEKRVYQLIYKKMKEIIEKTSENSKPEGYVTITFKKSEHSKLNADKDEISYHINPRAKVKIDSFNKLVGKDENGKKLEVLTPMATAFNDGDIHYEIKYHKFSDNNTTTWAYNNYDKISDDKPITEELEFQVQEKEQDKYKINYKFKSEDPQCELPEAITKKLNELEKIEKYSGYKVYKPNKKFDDIEINDGDLQGVWKFKSWDKEELDTSENQKNNIFTGTWTFTEKEKKNINYEFKKSDKIDKNLIPSERELPQGVKDQMPSSKKYYIGTKVRAEFNTNDRKPIPVEEEINGKRGVWTFEGWVNEDQTVTKDSSPLFIGKWTWKEIREAQITDRFTNTDGGPIEDENVKNIVKLLEKRNDVNKNNKAVKGVRVKPLDEPKVGKAIDVYKEGKKIGTWTFKGWKQSETVSDGYTPIVFEGIWEYKENKVNTPSSPKKEQPERKQPEKEQPEKKQPENKQPEIKQPEMKQPEKKQPENKQPEIKQPEIKQPKKENPVAPKIEKEEMFIPKVTPRESSTNDRKSSGEGDTIAERSETTKEKSNYRNEYSKNKNFIIKINKSANSKNYSNEKIKSKTKITRAEAMTIIADLIEVVKQKNETANDVYKNQWYAKAITKLQNAAIIEKDENGNIRPDELITKAELAEIIVKLKGLPLEKSNSKDAKSLEKTIYINACIKYGYFKDSKDNSFSPDSQVTGAELLEIVNKIINEQ